MKRLRARVAESLTRCLLIVSGGALGACTGNVESGAEPNGGPGASNAAGASGVGAGPGGLGTGGASSAAPGILNAPYTRLTRAEYRATVEAAFGVDPAVTGIPDDQRIGNFTSNVADPDPVQEFLLAAEDLAAQLVPSKFPVCAAGTAAACFSTYYQTPFERLFRKTLTASEQATFSALLGSLANAGQTAENATRAMVVYALMSSDFLFRATPVSGTKRAVDSWQSS